MDTRERWSPFTRLATGAAVVYCAVFAVMEVGVIATSWGGSSRQGVTALAATIAYLPFHLRHVWLGARAVRPAAGGWTLVVMAAIVAAATPLVGAGWLPSFHALAVSGLIVLPPPWSYVVAGAVTMVTLPVAVALEAPWPEAWRSTVDVLWRGTALFVLVWLSAALRNLDEARRALADEAVLRERQRIDAQLTHTLGTALESIAAAGGRASTMDADRTSVERELGGIVDASRRTLADARGMVSAFQRRSLSAELTAAVALLGAAGIETTVHVRDTDGDGDADGFDERSRSELRAATARVLHDRSVRRCVISVGREHDHISIKVSTEPR